MGNIKEKKTRPDNLYVKTISESEAVEALKSAGRSGTKYNTLRQELDLAWVDYKDDQETVIRFRNDENDITKDINLVTALEKKRKDGAPLTENEEQALALMSSEQLKAAREGVRDERIKVDTRKETFSKKIDRLQKAIEECKEQNSSTLVWQENGVWKKKWKCASEMASKIQSHKRPSEDVAKDFVEMLITPDGLLNIDYDRSTKIIREYKNIFRSGEGDYDLLVSILDDAEMKKEHLSREALAAMCYEALKEEYQREYVKTVEGVIKTNKTKKFEFQLPALYKARVEAVKTSKNGFNKNKPKKQNFGYGRFQNGKNRNLDRSRGGFTSRGQRGSYNRSYNNNNNRGNFNNRGNYFRGNNSRGYGYSNRGYGQNRGYNNFSQRGNYRGRGNGSYGNRPSWGNNRLQQPPKPEPEMKWGK